MAPAPNKRYGFNEQHISLASIKKKLSKYEFDLLLDILESIQVTEDLHYLDDGIVVLSKAVSYSLDFFKKFNDTPNTLINEIQWLLDLLSRVVIELQNSRLPPWNPIQGKYKNHPVFALLCVKPHSSLPKSIFSMIQVMTFLLFMLSFHRLTDSRHFYEKTCRELRFYLELKSEPSGGKLESFNKFNELTALFSDLRDKIFSNLQKSFIANIDVLVKDYFSAGICVRTGTQFPAKDLADKSSLDTPTVLDTSVKKDVHYYSGFTVKLNKKRFFINLMEDSEPTCIDCIEVEAEDTSASDRAKELSVIYGSRLGIFEKLSLQLNTNILSVGEWSLVKEYLLQKLDGNLKEKIGSSICLLLVITSKPLEYIEGLKVVMNTSLKMECLDLTDGTWNRHDVKMPKAFSAKPSQSELLHSHHPIVSYPVPDALVSCLKLLFKNTQVETLGELMEKNNVHLTEFVSEMNSQIARLHRPVTLANLRTVMFNRLVITESNGLASLVLANTEYATPSHLYYVSASHLKLKHAFSYALNQLGLEHRLSVNELDTTTFAGSQLVIRKHSVSELVDKKYQQLCEVHDYANMNRCELFTFHNQITFYSVLLLLINTGQRPRKEYAFEYLNIDLDEQIIMVADKLHFVDSAIRFIPLAEATEVQINAYRAHLRRMGNHLSRLKSPLADIFSANSHSDCKINFSLFGIIENDRWCSVGTAQLNEYLSEISDLPPNIFRHLFCRVLYEKGGGDSALQLMGHIGSGESVVDNYSCASIAEISALKPFIDELFSEMNIKPVEVNFPKGRQYVASSKVKSNNLYRPKYFSEYHTRDSDAKKIALESVRICHGKTKGKDFNFDRFYDDCTRTALEKISQLRLQSLASTVSFHLNRTLTRFGVFTGHSRKTYQYVEPYLNKVVDLDCLYNARVTNIFRHKASEKLIKLFLSKDIHDDERCALIVLSSIVHNLEPLVSTDNMNQALSFETEIFGSSVFFRVTTDKEEKFVLLDSVTALFALKARDLGKPLKINNAAQFVSEQLNTIVGEFGEEVIVLEPNLESKKHALYALENLLKSHCNVNTLGLVAGYIGAEYRSTSLPQKPLERLLAGGLRNVSECSGEETHFNITGSLYRPVKKSSHCRSPLIVKIYALLTDMRCQGAGPAFSLQIRKLWQSHVDAPSETLSVLVKHSSSLSDMTLAGLIYIIDVAKRAGKGRENIAVSSIQTYLSKSFNPLIELHHDVDFLFLEAEDYEEIYKNVLDYRNTDDRAEGARRLRDFHRSIENYFGIDAIDWFEVEPDINIHNENISANIITPDEYDDVLHELLNPEDDISYDQRCSALIFILSNRAGMRLNEICCLKLDDIDTSEWILHIRSNNLRRLKNKASNRRFPLYLFLSDKEKALLMEQIDTVKTMHQGAVNPPLFATIDNTTDKIDTRPHARYVISLLRHFSFDETLKNHHGRHSFGSFMLNILSCTHHVGLLSNQLKSWARTDDLDRFISALNETTLGKDYPLKYRAVYQVTQLLGHASPEITLRYYMHLMPFVKAVQSERWISEHVKLSQFALLSGYSAANIRKWKERAEHKDAIGSMLLQKKCEKKGLKLVKGKMSNAPTFKSTFSEEQTSLSQYLATHTVISQIAQGESDSVISQTVQISKSAISCLRTYLSSASTKHRFARISQGVALGANFIAHNYVSNPFFRAVLVRWVRMQLSEMERTDAFEATLTQNLLQDEVIIEEWQLDSVYFFCGKLGLVCRSENITERKSKRMKLESPVKVNFFKHSLSERTWNNKILYLIMLIEGEEILGSSKNNQNNIRSRSTLDLGNKHGLYYSH